MERKARPPSAASCCVFAVIAASHVQCAHAQAATSPPESELNRDATTFVLGNVEYLLLHEIAHFLINEKSVPIIGPEENAADYIATLALIREEPLDPEQGKRGVGFLLAAADAFVGSWKIGTALGAEIPYWGSHALGIQRYYQIVCLLYGSNPAAFEPLRQVAALPESRAQGCVAEYARAEDSIAWLLANYGRQPDDAHEAVTEIRYEPPRTLVAARMLEELRSQQLLERSLDRLHDRFTLERPFMLVLRNCGQPEAAWIPDRRELVICYEIMDTLYLLALRR